MEKSIQKPDDVIYKLHIVFEFSQQFIELCDANTESMNQEMLSTVKATF